MIDKIRRLKQIMRYNLNCISGKQYRVPSPRPHAHEWVGTDYGGCPVCLSALPQNPIIYSFGVGEDISFDLEIIKLTGGTVYAYDPTPKSIAFLKTLDLPENFTFTGCAVSDSDKELTFYLPNNPAHVSGSLAQTSNVGNSGALTVQGKKVSTMMRENGHAKIDLLKMDIEGSEFDVIADMLNDGVDCSQICMETHERFLKDGKERMRKTMEKLYASSYKVFAVAHHGLHVSLIKDA